MEFKQGLRVLEQFPDRSNFVLRRKKKINNKYFLENFYQGNLSQVETNLPASQKLAELRMKPLFLR